MPTKIAALFVANPGCYIGLPDVDPWDVTRDARLYAGPHPVVAHPPCHLWVNFAALNFRRWGGEHNRPGNDGGCFGAALSAIRRWGGVLEHPASSHAWSAYNLLRPQCRGWSEDRFSGDWICEVWQSAYGHLARKRTWLLYSGKEPPPPMRWERPTGSMQIGKFDRIKPTLYGAKASATPLAFRDALIALARSVRQDAETPKSANG
jgi:hypothetical protein